VGSNTESGITVDYQDADNTLDFTVGTLNQDTTGTAATVTGAAQTSITSLGTLTTLTVDNIIVNGTNIGHTSDTDSIAIAADGVVTFSQTPVLSGAGLTAGTTPLTTLDIDGGTDIGADLVATDLIAVDDGASGTNRKSALSRMVTFMSAQGFVTDDPTALAIALG
jgi:hypothetical protein